MPRCSFVDSRIFKRACLINSANDDVEQASKGPIETLSDVLLCDAPDSSHAICRLCRRHYFQQFENYKPKRGITDN